MRTSKVLFGLFFAGVLAAAGDARPALAKANAGVQFSSSAAALDQGIAAYNGGYYEIALPALEAATGTERVLALLYLARIYADNTGTYTDHAKAFGIYRRLAEELRDVDADDDARAPIAAKSLTALSGYLRSGLPEAGIAANVPEADQALKTAALIFEDEDAEFELAKVLLRGEGPDTLGEMDAHSKVARGRDTLSRLSRKGHAGAQAFLADLMWRGKFMPVDQARALNLIDVAVANAPVHERVWIEDIYQNIYCNAGEGVRTQATGRVAEWHERYKRRVEPRVDRSGLANLENRPVRTCANGEPVLPIERADKPQEPSGIETLFGKLPSLRATAPKAGPPGNDLGVGFAP